MPFGGRGRLTWLKEPCIRRGCTLAPPDEYSGMICAAAAMRDVTTFAAATFFVIVALTWLPCSCIDVNWHQRLLQPSSHCDDVVKTLWTEAVKCAPVHCLRCHPSLADMLSATAHHLFGTSYRYPPDLSVVSTH